MVGKDGCIIIEIYIRKKMARDSQDNPNKEEQGRIICPIR